MDPQHWTFYILFMYRTVSCIVVDCHRFHAGSGAFHFNCDPDPDPDPTLFYMCWKIKMAFLYSQGTAVKDYAILSILVSVIDNRYRYFQYFGQYNE
jgi:hypothetical protein